MRSICHKHRQQALSVCAKANDRIATYHLNRDVQARFQVELATTLREEVFQTLAQQVHDHHVVCLAVVGALISHEVQERHEGLAAELVDELALPEKHNVSLRLNRFLL